jgi:acetyl-CoA carboxylase biotin carboxyl carrier protein
VTTVHAEMNARVLQLPVPDGAQVAIGDVVAILESMKMEIPVSAPASGTLRLLVTEGADVAGGDHIAEIV